MPRTPESFLVTSASLEAEARIQMALSVATPDLAALNLEYWGVAVLVAGVLVEADGRSKSFLRTKPSLPS